MDMNAYLSMFIDESNDHLQALNENLLKLESDPADIGIVQIIFRSAHTLKGMSATMGFEDLASLTHEMENVLDLVRNGKLTMDAFIFDVLFKGLDALETMVADITAGGAGKADVAELLSSLKSIVDGSYLAKESAAGAGAQAASKKENGASADLDEFQLSVLKQSVESGLKAVRLDVELEDSCVLKAARSYMVFNFLEQHGEVIKSIPSVTDLEQEKFDKSFTVILVTSSDEQAIAEGAGNISEIAAAAASLLDEAALEALAHPEIPEAAKAADARTADVQAASSAASEAKRQTAAASAPAAQAASRTIRVDIDRLDSLMNLFSELLIDRVRLEQLSSEIGRTELSETVEHLSRISGDLQNIVLKLRMVPIDSVFNRFPRMVRDLAKNLNKKVDLVIVGADTELDRTVIDEIGDPLVHLLRNSLDHGLETTDGRLEAGKPETGTIFLRAYHSGNHVFIEVEEDGRGINSEKVKAKAVENGVLSGQEAARMTQDEINNLIFAPGFSTADAISDISGRGVGLDVVRSKILSLGGNVSVESKAGIGSKFSIQLPLTLSIITAMLIKLGSEKYAIPLSSIVETGILSRDSILNVHGSRMITYRNAVIPLVSLGNVLETADFNEEEELESEYLVIRKGDKWAAVIVDDFIGQSEIVLKSMGGYLGQTQAVSGATILGDGQVALIIDPNALFK
ncbi:MULTISPECIES: chemotaxis protein CheA [unclassified Paenibacillus]|uniref:chemotaxis protein CheA n=1 Tax=unclassified Paenibacillus TaxID=185978 RepID=UPI00095626B7|nr:MULTISPECIES: chemotaxis protein CheA [unclassified Paenibacillus]ASS65697.1 chemotaxis protein CheA [Paenibacillus sp. RUD330]SIQ26982.1 two-component system, chemotaxis family, sensor kinase CheA [Paenibacillus sp. RU4X]SIQ49008.1 two-component system, chemotaxis family, sensor kinase CheA [Paenibacillus sp. RU4T]